MLLEARTDVGGTAASESFAGAHRQRLQLRPSHVPHDAGDGRARPGVVRAAVHRRRAGAAPHGVERRTVVDPVPRRRPDARLARRHSSWRGRRVSPVPPRRDARREVDPRRGVRAAEHPHADPPGGAPPAGGRPDDPAMEPAQRGRRAAVVLPSRRPGGHRRRERADGVGHQPRAPAQRPRRADPRDAPRRDRRSTGRRERHGADGDLACVRASRRRRCASTAPSTRSCATAMPCAASHWATGSRSPLPIVVSACDPHRTFLEWLRNPPPGARDVVRRWRALPHPDGYESKIDAVVSVGAAAAGRRRPARHDDDRRAQPGGDRPRPPADARRSGAPDPRPAPQRAVAPRRDPARSRPGSIQPGRRAMTARTF